jgi:hypothetical protein
MVRGWSGDSENVTLGAEMGEDGCQPVRRFEGSVVAPVEEQVSEDEKI